MIRHRGPGWPSAADEQSIVAQVQRAMVLRRVERCELVFAAVMGVMLTVMVGLMAWGFARLVG